MVNFQPPFFNFKLHIFMCTLREQKTYCSSVAQSCPTLCNPMDCSTPGLPVHHHLPELAQTHVHRVRDAIQPSHPLSPPSPPALNLSQHQGLRSLFIASGKTKDKSSEHKWYYLILNYLDGSEKNYRKWQLPCPVYYPKRPLIDNNLRLPFQKKTLTITGILSLGKKKSVKNLNKE